MTTKKQFVNLGLTALSAFIVLTTLVGAPRAAAQTETVLSNIPISNGGLTTNSALVRDGAGNLYGATQTGGAYGYGMVFELSPPAAGATTWTETIPHTFGVFPTDGHFPASLGLILDAAGNLYGTTYQGGAFGGGTVFELTPKSGGGWTEKILYSFHNSGTGPNNPEGLIFDAAGNLYGPSGGGFYGNGAVFELSPKAGGGWAAKTLHSFGAFPTDGLNPIGGLVLDGAGNIYGTTYMGGAHTASNDGGTMFELIAPAAGGRWTEKVLHSFGIFPDGWDPFGGLVMDGAGNFYGMTFNGGVNDTANTGGTVFELSPTGSGGWTETVLHNFSDNHMDGFWPGAGLTLDAAGNLYGTAQAGGVYETGPDYVRGVLFELTPPAAGTTTWTETILHSFGAGKDGQDPNSNVILDGSGNFYGTTNRGGTYGGGTVFEVTP